MRTLSTQSDAHAVCWYCLIYSGQTCCRFNKYCGCLLNFCRGPYPSNQASRQPTRDLGRTKKRTIASVEYCNNNFVVTCVLLHCTSLMMFHCHLFTLALSQARSRIPTTLRKPIMRLHSTQMSSVSYQHIGRGHTPLDLSPDDCRDCENACYGPQAIALLCVSGLRSCVPASNHDSSPGSHSCRGLLQCRLPLHRFA